MRVQRLILFSVMTAVAEIRFPGVWRPPQGIPVKPALLALPIHIVAGVAREFSVLQREVSGRGQWRVQFRADIQRMAVAGRHAVMTPVAEQLVVAVVFQINIAPFNRRSFMALTAIPSGKVDVGILIDDRGLRFWHCRFLFFLLGQRQATPERPENNQKKYRFFSHTLLLVEAIEMPLIQPDTPMATPVSIRDPGRCRIHKPLCIRHNF